MSDEAIDPGAFIGGLAPVTAFMSDGVVAVPASTTLREVARTISEETIGVVVVGSVDQVEGVVSERDIVRSAAAGSDLDAVTAGDLQTDSLVWATTDSTIGDVAVEMMQGYVRHVLVRDGESLVGVVSMRDVIAAFTTA